LSNIVLFTTTAFHYLLLLEGRVTAFHVGRQARRIVTPFSFTDDDDNKYSYHKYQSKKNELTTSRRLSLFGSTSSLMSQTTSATDNSSKKRNSNNTVLAAMRKFILILWKLISLPMRILFSSSSKNSKEDNNIIETKTSVSNDVTNATILMTDTTVTMDDIDEKKKSIGDDGNVDATTVIESTTMFEQGGPVVEKDDVSTAAPSSSSPDNVSISIPITTIAATAATAKMDDIDEKKKPIRDDGNVDVTTVIESTTMFEEGGLGVEKDDVSTAAPSSSDNASIIDKGIPIATTAATATTDTSSINSGRETKTTSNNVLGNSNNNGVTYIIKPKDGEERWALGAVDMTGEWQLMDTEQFKKEYDRYLQYLGQPKIVRAVALGLIGFTTESTEQTKEGRELSIRGRNPRGVWERCLIASGADGQSAEYEPLYIDVCTADDEIVKSESWWENNGKVHRSWMRGGSKFGGGDFESTRYLENDGKVLVCESTFHPIQENRKKAQATWRFLRKGETI